MTCSDPPTSAADEPRTSRDHLVEQLKVIPVPPGSIIHLHNPDPDADWARVSRDIETRIGHDEFLIVATTGDSDLTVDQSGMVEVEL